MVAIKSESEKSVVQSAAKADSGFFKPKPLDKTSLVLFTLSFVAACTMFFSHLGDMPIFSPDEALYAEPAREMLETGEYVTTYLNYEVRYTKPPLFIWAIAAYMNAFGVSEFAARAFSAACGAILVGITYLFTEKFFNRRSAILAALILTLSPMYLAISRLAITDIPLALFVSGAMMALFYGFATGESRWKWGAYVLLGCGVMTKGPVAIVLPALVLIPYHLVMGEVKKAWSYYKPILGLLVIALIAVPWFALETWVTKGEYFQSFIMRENLQRFTGVVDHKYPWWYHLAVMGGGFFPFTLALPFAWFASLKAPFSNDGEGGLLARLRSIDHGQRAALFATVAALAILIFFSASVSKLLPYTLPAFPFLAMVTAVFLVRLSDNKRWLPAALGFAGFTLVASGSFALLPVLEARLRDCPPELISYLPGYITFMAATGLIPLLMAAFKRVYASILVFIVMLASGVLYFGPGLQSIFADSWERPLQAFVQYSALSDRDIYICNLRKPSATFYALRRVEMEESLEGLFERFKNVETAYVIGRHRHKDIYLASKDFKTVAQSGRFILLDYVRNRK